MVDVSTDEIWTFLCIIILMEIHRLPRVKNYWSIDSLLGVPAIQQSMPLNRFWAIWSTIHVVGNDVIDGRGCPFAKIKPHSNYSVLDLYEVL